MRSRWNFQVSEWTCLFLLLSMDEIPSLSKVNLGTQAASIDKRIFDSTPHAKMFDFFHVMPEGNVKVLIEWDLLLTMEQYQALYQKNRRVKRKALADINKKWTNGYVYYEVHESLDTLRDRAVIKAAIDEWEMYTCLNFIENSTNDQRIVFKDGGGCYSQLGMQDSGPQAFVLAKGCMITGIITHEIGHAVGWIHEHMRPDRDEYIYVNLDAIAKINQDGYRKYEPNAINTYGIPYDYTSVMHYGNDIYPDSLLTLDPSYQDKLGQREGFSFKDIKLANVMYDCADLVCDRKLDCPGDGFQMPKHHKGKGKCECWCDSGKITDPLVMCSERETPPSPLQHSPTPTAMPKKTCRDVRNDCKYRKRLGHCETKVGRMMLYCSKTCNFCDKGEGACMDNDKGCSIMAVSGACTKPGFRKQMEHICKASCGLCLKSPDPNGIQNEMMGHNPNIPGLGTALTYQLFSYLLLVLALCTGSFT